MKRKNAWLRDSTENIFMYFYQFSLKIANRESEINHPCHTVN